MNRVRVVITIYKMHTCTVWKNQKITLIYVKIFGEKVVILYEWSDYKKRVLVKCNDDRLYLAEKYFVKSILKQLKL